MKKIYLVLSLALTGAVLPACKQEEKSINQEDLITINNEVLNNTEAYKLLGEATSTIGHRLTGSENGSQAETFMFEMFQSFGFDEVEYQPFTVEAWQRKSLTLTVIDGKDSNDIPTVSLAHSPVKADLKETIVDLGNGLENDYEANAGKVKGKIALVYISLLPDSEGKKNLHRSEKTALARKFGASGIIFINQVPGGVLLTGTASVTGQLIDIPAICIGYEDGMALKDKLKEQKLEAHIIMENESNVVKARNVVATLPGKSKNKEEIIIGGHLDSWDLATGAIDNGIGVFSIIDIARTFRSLELQPDRTIKFIMFMGEEQGLLGSKAFINDRKERGTLERIKYMINLDMAGNPTGFNAAGREETLKFFDKIGEEIHAIDTVFRNENRNTAGLHSDHQPFMLEGIPVASLVSNLNPEIYDCYHADCDDFDLADAYHMENTVRFTSMMLYRLANVNKLPAGKLSDKATRRFLADQGLEEKLRLQGDWRWK